MAAESFGRLQAGLIGVVAFASLNLFLFEQSRGTPRDTAVTIALEPMRVVLREPELISLGIQTFQQLADTFVPKALN